VTVMGFVSDLGTVWLALADRWWMCLRRLAVKIRSRIQQARSGCDAVRALRADAALPRRVNSRRLSANSGALWDLSENGSSLGGSIARCRLQLLRHRNHLLTVRVSEHHLWN